MTEQGPMTRPELEGFLTEGLVCRFSCLDDRGWPYVVPVWFDWDGSEFWIVAKEHAKWVEWTIANPKVALCIDVTGPNRRVMCQGQARIVESQASADLLPYVFRRMGKRYVADRLEQYVASMTAQEHWLIAVKPKRLMTWQGPSRD